MGLIKKKICLLGAFAVGKTSLTERFVHGRFEEKYLTTVGVRISRKIVPPVQAAESGRLVQHEFLVWDIAGLEKFDHVADNYFRGAAGALAEAARPPLAGQCARARLLHRAGHDFRRRRIHRASDLVLSPLSASAAPTDAERWAVPAGGIDLEDVERRLIVSALEQSGHNKTKGARLLGLSRDTLRYRLDKFGIG